MAKEITGKIKLQCPAGQATPAPPVGRRSSTSGCGCNHTCTLAFAVKRAKGAKGAKGSRPLTSHFTSAAGRGRLWGWLDLSGWTTLGLGTM